MSLGDWIQSAIASLGILATALVARMVYLFEQRDRKTEKSSERASQKELEDQRRVAEIEKEKRQARREQHKDDYGAVSRALSVLEKAFDAAESKPFTESEFEAAGIEEAMATILEVSNRVAGLKDSLSSLWFTAVSFTRVEFPEPADFDRVDGDTEKLHSVLRDAVRSGVIQGRYSLEGLDAVRRARRALAAEWGTE